MKAWELPRSFQRKALNSDNVMEVARSWRRLCWAHLRLIALRKKVAAKGVLFILVAPEVSK